MWSVKIKLADIKICFCNDQLTMDLSFLKRQSGSGRQTDPTCTGDRQTRHVRETDRPDMYGRQTDPICTGEKQTRHVYGGIRIDPRKFRGDHRHTRLTCIIRENSILANAPTLSLTPAPATEDASPSPPSRPLVNCLTMSSSSNPSLCLHRIFTCMYNKVFHKPGESSQMANPCIYYENKTAWS